MNQKVQELTEGILNLIQPYLGKREFGNLHILGKKFPTDDMGSLYWDIIYDTPFHSADSIGVEYIKDRDLFRYLAFPSQKRTSASNVQTVLNNVRKRLENIKPQRLDYLRKNAQLEKERGLTLEMAVADMRKFAEQYPKTGPTEEELQLYEKFCREVYSQ